MRKITYQRRLIKKIKAVAKKAELEEENLKKNLEQDNSISEKLKK